MPPILLPCNVLLITFFKLLFSSFDSKLTIQPIWVEADNPEAGIEIELAPKP